ADDVVLARVAAHLNLDQFKRDPARIGESVHGPDRDVDRLVLMHEGHSLIHGHLGGSLHDNPVLGPVMVLLERQASARGHHDALHLEAGTMVDALVPAPGPVHAAVLAGLGALLGAHGDHEFLHHLRAAPRGHEYGV